MEVQSDNPYQTPSSAPGNMPIEDGQIFELATRGERFLGSIVDAMISMVFVYGVIYLFSLLTLDILPVGNLFSYDVLIVGIYVVFFLILNGWCLTSRGQTLGKIVMKTKIVARDGTKAGLVRLVVVRYGAQWIAQIIPVVGDFLLFADSLAILFSRENLCLHDRIAGTKVVSLKRPKIAMPQPRRMEPMARGRVSARGPMIAYPQRQEKPQVDAPEAESPEL